MHDENENDLKNDLNTKDRFLVNIMNSVRKVNILEKRFANKIIKNKINNSNGSGICFYEWYLTNWFKDC